MGYQFDDKDDTNRQQEYRRSDSVVGTSKVSPKGHDQSKKRIVLAVRLKEGQLRGGAQGGIPDAGLRPGSRGLPGGGLHGPPRHRAASWVYKGYGAT